MNTPGFVKIDCMLHPHKEKPMDWIGARYTPASQSYPSWPDAGTKLQEFIQKITTFLITQNPEYPSDFSMGLEMPSALDENDHVVSILDTFPPDVKEHIRKVCNEVTFDYCPDLDQFKGHNVTDEVICALKDQIHRRWQLIKEAGGRTINNELAFRLGVPPFILNLPTVNIEVDMNK